MSLNNIEINDEIKGVVTIWWKYTKRKITR
jgi:hypothetical protein